MMKELGSGNYQPSVSAFFPKLGRGHSVRNCPGCKGGGSKGHLDQKGNREEWEASVGIKRSASRTTRRAEHGAKQAQSLALDPKQLLTLMVAAAIIGGDING